MLKSFVSKIKSLFQREKFPVFLQADRFDCGPACLKMIAKSYGKNISIEHLRYICKISPDGVSLRNIIGAAEELGMQAIPAKIDYQTLVEQAPLPCIVFWRDRHFVIVYKTKGDTVFVADPAFGRVTYKKEDFIRAWHHSDQVDERKEAITVLFEPTPAFYEQEDNDPVEGLRTIIPYLKNYTRYMSQVFIGLLVGIVIQLALPLVTQSLVDKGINVGDIHFVYVLLIAQLALFVSSSLISIIRSWLLLHIGARVSMLVTSDYLVRLMNKTTSFFDGKTPGDILQRINESTRLETFLNAAPTSVFAYLNALVFLFILAYYSLIIFGIFVVGIILYTVWVWYFMKKREALDFQRFEASSSINSTLIQMVNGIQEVKVNGSEKRHIWEWQKNRIKYYKNAVSNLKLTQLQTIGGDVINELKNILITFTAAFLVIDGSITLGAMLAIQYIIGQVNAPLLSLIGFLRMVQDARISLERFKEIEHITEEEEQLNNNKLIHLPPQVEGISIRNLQFSYEGKNGQPILKNINLDIPKGKTTAIVGNSGSGKTTLVKLLLKLYLPSEGEILVGSTNLTHIESKSWRSLCGTVMQDGYIFSDSLLNNITESASEEFVDVKRLLEAAKIANIEELINSLPSGFHSMIGPAGSSGRTLSGGQRQRVLIARAVYKNPHFLFFDEATSALDTNNEKQIVENLKEVQKDKTVVVIAHRLSTVREADQIVVLNEGEICERGTHAELVAKKGYYYTLIKNQLELGN